MEGWAWAYKHYLQAPDASEYIGAEKQARADPILVMCLVAAFAAESAATPACDYLIAGMCILGRFLASVSPSVKNKLFLYF
jgi:hypothetical protein